MAAESSADHTEGPASPSTVSVWVVSNRMTAPLVITPYVPGTHCEVSAEGSRAHRHVNVPAWTSASWVGAVGVGGA